ncbi:mevalonate kinase [Patescibacteria group bacterium]|nr:mevalonate kinase [Patescibacteria group bacterium]
MMNKFAPSALTVSAPGKIHLLGEWSVVWGKPAILAAVDLRVAAAISKSSSNSHPLKEVIEPIVKKELNIKKIPSYNLKITSDIPIGAGLGSSAAVSAASIAALLSFLKVKWDLKLVNKLAYEAEKIFHGNPSGGDNLTVVYGGLVWFTRTNSEKLNLGGFRKLAKNFVMINTGTPKETTKQMIEMVSKQFTVHGSRFKKFLDHQEQLVRELLPAIKNGNEKELIRIIRAGEKNLEGIGVVSPYVKSIIGKIEKAGGAGKICGAGGKEKATGVLLCYHPKKEILEKIAKSYNLDCFNTKLGVGGLKNES